MKKIIVLTMVIFFTGCGKVDKNQAENLVIKEKSNELGAATIVETLSKDDDYYVEWENQVDKSSGIVKVTKSGKLIIVEEEIE